jgi:DNA-binding response OmpR family regulator
MSKKVVNMIQAGAKKILIIEDEPDLAQIIVDLLQSENLVVKHSQNGNFALEELQSGYKPDLVICDLAMPQMDGFEFLKRAFLIDANLHVLVLTAFGDPEKIVKCMRLGCKDFVTKPFDSKIFLDKVFVNLEIARIQAEGSESASRHHLMRIKNSSEPILAKKSNTGDFSDF